MEKETIPLEKLNETKISEKTVKIISCTLSLFVAATSIQISLLDEPSLFQLISLGGFTLALPPFILASLMGVMAENNTVDYKWPDWYKKYHVISLKYILIGSYFFLLADKSFIIGTIFLISSTLLTYTVFNNFVLGSIAANQNLENMLNSQKKL